MNDLVKSVRAAGGSGVVGVFLPLDPGSTDKLAKLGKIVFDFGMFWFKGQRIATGQANVKAYNRHLRNLIHTGRAKPSWIVSHELALDEAPDAYKHFDACDQGWTKVILRPNGVQRSAKRQSFQRKLLHKESLHAH
jgi:threonine dehydrogenase-like Zn-dependent dehydrogenase